MSNTKQAEPAWKRYELAVHRALKQLDPNWKIEHNAHLIDAFSGSKRQVDVHIEAMLGGIVPVKIHVSCKRTSRKLSITAIDHVAGESQATGTKITMLFSSAGFSETAIKAAKSRGVLCMKLFENEPPSVPDEVPVATYILSPVLQIASQGTPHDLGYDTWTDVAKLHRAPGLARDLVTTICYLYDEIFVEQYRDSMNGGDPNDSCEFCIELKSGNASVDLVCKVQLIIFMGHHASYKLRGIHNLTDQLWNGVFETPSFDTSDPPGDGWIECSEIEPPKGSVAFTMRGITPDQVLNRLSKM